MRNLLVVMGYKNLQGKWDISEVLIGIVVISLAFIAGYALASALGGV